MDFLNLLFIGIGLAMDCFAVSTTKGMMRKSFHEPRFVLMAILFGLFQGGMPLIGYFAGTLFVDFFKNYAPWIALFLLAFIGGKMIVESLKKNEDDTTSATDFSLRTLIMLAIATSIDALATGVIFIPSPNWLWVGIGIIALTSLLFSLAGYSIGVVFGKRFSLNVELIGGIILVLIGLKIWAEGLGFIG